MEVCPQPEKKQAAAENFHWRFPHYPLLRIRAMPLDCGGNGSRSAVAKSPVLMQCSLGAGVRVLGRGILAGRLSILCATPVISGTANIPRPALQKNTERVARPKGRPPCTALEPEDLATADQDLCDRHPCEIGAMLI